MVKRYRHCEALVDDIRNTVVPANAVALWNLGQAGVLLKGESRDGGKQLPTIVIDPYLTRAIETNQPGTEFVREYDAPLAPEDLAGVAMVLLTHHHDDHLDLSTIGPLHKASPGTRFIIPAPHVGMLRDIGISDDAIILAHAGQTIHTGDVEILPVAAAHTEYETDSSGDHLYLGYVVSMNGIRVYHSGDTIVTDELVQTMKAVKPHIAMLPINGGDYARSRRGIVGNMTAREAVDFAVEIGADMLLPNHYDMFPNNRDNPAHFVDYLFHHHRNLKFHMSTVGERFIYLS
ncbi:MBL fold metallo-hydrolase [Alicyclobacillus dauci]|uniref:MBL fold metallo-hydrolase n=1 Tax=Alicyclobacillus dauci TaxID=1475485 RepID=A0ABY6Z572_9BACL|nr:MBL fold metallo-hydrolase [Alicyclobacillus dauci]WAH38033.1 MBL fold metallo-hydrolase [Alicyclobacillus dauci]